jgi:hypothetical protein
VMLKTILPFAAALLSLSLADPAWADVRSGSGSGSNRGEACQAAKRFIACAHGVERYGECECGRDDNPVLESRAWTCTVNAYCKDVYVGHSAVSDIGVAQFPGLTCP